MHSEEPRDGSIAMVATGALASHAIVGQRHLLGLSGTVSSIRAVSETMSIRSCRERASPHRLMACGWTLALAAAPTLVLAHSSMAGLVGWKIVKRSVRSSMIVALSCTGGENPHGVLCTPGAPAALHETLVPTTVVHGATMVCTAFNTSQHVGNRIPHMSQTFQAQVAFQRVVRPLVKRLVPVSGVAPTSLTRRMAAATYKMLRQQR
jgi:hypothetical protein